MGSRSIEIFLCNQRYHSEISPTFWRPALNLLSGKVQVQIIPQDAIGGSEEEAKVQLYLCLNLVLYWGV
jgi:hypothetical protein